MIESIAFKNFLGAEDLSFNLGRAPVVLITAGNGQGKSRILDALAWCLWGKTLRKVNPGPDAWARVVLGGDSHILRGKGVKGDVVLVQADCEAARGKTKVQEPVAALVGEERAWLRALYLKGQTVAAFAGGSDTERFAHLEFVTGVWRLNAVYDAAREAHAAAAQKEREADREFERSTMALKEAESALGLCPVAMPSGSGTPIKELEQRVAHALHLLTTAEQDMARMAAHLEACEEAFKAASDALEAVRRNPPERPTCEACGQKKRDYDHEMRVQDAEDENRRAFQPYDMARRRLPQLEREITAANWAAANAQSALADRLNARALFNQAEETYYRAAHRWLLEAHRVEAASQAQEGARSESLAAGLAKRALAPTGARMAYLGSLLGRIEARANRHLAHLGAVRVGLTLQGSKLLLTTSGIGAPDYASASSGQQRRVDIALLLAMSEIAAEVGTLPATAPLVIDEAFDTLDTEGVSALVSLACDIARQRQVFLVSHAEPEIPMGSGVLHIRL